MAVEEAVMMKSQKPNDLKDRIENAKKGIFDEEQEGDDDEDAGAVKKKDK